MAANSSAATALARLAERYDQIVIGMGASALTFLHSAFMAKNALFLKKNTLVIGKDHLWARTAAVKPDHLMGQPAPLLQPQAPGKGANTEKTLDHYTGLDQGNYLTTQSFVDRANDLKSIIREERAGAQRSIDFLHDSVTRVSKMGQALMVKASSGRAFLAEQVIVASGIGPPKIVPELDIEKNGKVENKQLITQKPRPFPEIVDAVSYYTYLGKMPQGLRVLVYGGSATAAWAASYAYLTKADYYWMCRKGIDQISKEGNPVGRNTEVIKKSVDEDRILKGSIKSVKVIEPKESSSNTPWRLSPRLRVTMDVDYLRSHNRKWVKDDKTKQLELQQDYETRQVSIDFHQIVHALGSNPVGTDPLGTTGPGGIIEDGLRGELEPVYKKDFQIGGDTKECLVAFRTTDDALWVVGAAVFGGAGSKSGDVGAQYSAIGNVLPHAARPPEGIAILTAAINALTGYTDLDPKTFDWNRSSPKQIRELFKKLYSDIVPGIREVIVEDLIKVRTDTKFDFSKAVVRKTLEDFKTVYPKVQLDIKRLHLE